MFFENVEIFWKVRKFVETESLRREDTFRSVDFLWISGFYCKMWTIVGNECFILWKYLKMIWEIMILETKDDFREGEARFGFRIDFSVK